MTHDRDDLEWERQEQARDEKGLHEGQAATVQRRHVKCEPDHGQEESEQPERLRQQMNEQ